MHRCLPEGITRLKSTLDGLFSDAAPGLPMKVGSLTTSRYHTDAKAADGRVYEVCKQVTSDESRQNSSSVIYEITPLNTSEHKDDSAFVQTDGRATNIVYGISGNVVLTRHGLDADGRLRTPETSEFTTPEQVTALLAKMQGIVAIKEA